MAEAPDEGDGDERFVSVSLRGLRNMLVEHKAKLLRAEKELVHFARATRSIDTMRTVVDIAPDLDPELRVPLVIELRTCGDVDIRGLTFRPHISVVDPESRIPWNNWFTVYVVDFSALVDPTKLAILKQILSMLLKGRERVLCIAVMEVDNLNVVPTDVLASAEASIILSGADAAIPVKVPLAVLLRRPSEPLSFRPTEYNGSFGVYRVGKIFAEWGRLSKLLPTPPAM